MLNIHDVCVEKQAAVLRVWLRSNPPGRLLRLSLLSNGYGHIIDEAIGRPVRKHSA